jgi:AP-2 complex subunit mu-1
MLSGILIFNQKGENLIFRSFRNDCRPRLADVFRIQVISNAQVRSPILTLGSTTFSHVKHENIYLVAITKSNANAALVFEFLYRLIQLGRGYFGKFDEEAVKNNFVLVYELLDGTCPRSNWWPIGSPIEYRTSIVNGLWFSRNYRLRLPPKHGDGYAENVHHDRRRQVGKGG